MKDSKVKDSKVMTAPAAAGKKAATNQGIPRMHELYRKTIAPELMKQFKHGNAMAVAQIQKIVLNMGCGEAAHDAKVLESAQKDLGLIAGQRPTVTRAKLAISNFKIKENDPVGVKVTLRRARMYEFLDRLISTALPRIRDFRGLSPNGFDQGGNYSFGLKEHTIFPEVEIDKTYQVLGMDIVIVLSTQSREEAFALLKAFGFPFAAAKA